MKKHISILLFILFSLPLLAQDETTTLDNIKKNEIRLNALHLVFGAVTIDYEHLLNEESGLGVSIFLPIDDDIDINYYVSPYYRFYFGKKPAAGFFVEGFGMLNSTADFVFNENFPDNFRYDESVTDFALGVGIGGKFLTKKGFVAELAIGFGRNLFVTDGRDFEYVGKGGIELGFRF